MDRVGLYFTDEYPLELELRMARLAEQNGFSAVWQGESRMARDSIVSLAAIAAVTSRVEVGTGVLHTWTRNVATLATTFSTLSELTNGKTVLGIGALWEPMAFKIGVERKTPLKAVREYVEVLKRLFKGEEVTYRGDHVKVNGIRLEKPTKYIPVYIGATGFKMIEVAGEVADGVVLNYLVTPQYNDEAMKHLAAGASRSGRRVEEIERPQLIAVVIDKDEEAAIKKGKHIIADYIGQEPHLMKASGVDQSLIDECHRIMGAWPPRPGSIDEAAKLVPDREVKRLLVAGTPESCRMRVREFVEHGCTLPLLCPTSGNVELMIKTFSEGYA
jgi:5,10-methylenetetrahydromethanopterin reductase